MRTAIDRLIEEYQTVPPPWIVYREHPYSMCWRMGGGESHIILWWRWWSDNNWTEEDNIDYFRLWPPPHCWLPFMIQAVWKIDIDESDDVGSGYFDRLTSLGFGSRRDYELDLNDPKWDRP